MEFKNEKIEEFEKYIVGKKVAIIGLGVSNIPLLDYFFNLQAKVSVFDKRNITKLDKDVIEKIHKYQPSIPNFCWQKTHLFLYTHF